LRGVGSVGQRSGICRSEEWDLSFRGVGSVGEEWDLSERSGICQRSGICRRGVGSVAEEWDLSCRADVFYTAPHCVYRSALFLLTTQLKVKG
jgi:hypothetical protein